MAALKRLLLKAAKLAATLAVGALLPLPTLASPPSDPLCGTAIQADLVLDHDVVCYNSPGIIVAAEDLTIDLNGKNILCSNGKNLGCMGAGFVGIDASSVRRIAIRGPGGVYGYDLSLVVKRDDRLLTRNQPRVARRQPPRQESAK